MSAEMIVDLGEANPKQAAFYRSTARYTAYGGARGGGKSHAVRVLAVREAFLYPGIRILIVRRTYPELESSVIAPFLRLVPGELIKYNATGHVARFVNGSVVKFGHFSSELGELEYQGQEYDRIFIDEATQFTERQFRVLGACLRGVNEIPKRMYLTCNPGGVGHAWVKRLFVDRRYRDGERAEDYAFIPATVEDNRHLLEASPEYVRLLDALPEDMRRAHRYGDWNVLSGQYFTGFSAERHVVRTAPPPKGAALYRAFDYGLDMFACVWVAVSADGTAYVYREVQREGLIVSRAAKLMQQLTPPGEQIRATIAPPDIWSTQKDTGRTMAQVFHACGVGLVRAPAARVQGWMMLAELLECGADTGPRLRIADCCEGLIASLPQLRRDKLNPSDCDTEPHELTHICDALRYFAAYRYGAPAPDEESEPDGYGELMRGGSAAAGYLLY